MRPATQQIHREGILRVLLHIQHHLDQDLPLADLGSVAHLSPFHFHRIFREQTGETVMEHIRRLRLEQAAFRLRTTRLPITRIALAAGYGAPEAFSRAFRARFGLSPLGFRRVGSSFSYRPLPTCVPDTPLTHFPPDDAPDAVIPEYEVSIKRLSVRNVAFMRIIGPYGSGWTAWQRLLDWAREAGRLRRGSNLIGLRHDYTDITPPDRCRYDACIPVNDAFAPRGEIGVQQICGGDYAMVTHRGPYGTRFDAYAYLCNRWIPMNRRLVRPGPIVEFYRRNGKSGSSENLITTICVPLEARSTRRVAHDR